MVNDKVYELAEKAGFYVDNDKICIPTTSEDITACQTKFAELIWQAAYEEGHDVGVDVGFEAGRNASFTEQHFGVEQ
jgi:hypothetical protein